MYLSRWSLMEVQKMGGEGKKREAQLSWKWMEGYGQGDENKLYVQDWRNYGISARLWALRDCTFSEGILKRLEAQMGGEWELCSVRAQACMTACVWHENNWVFLPLKKTKRRAAQAMPSGKSAYAEQQLWCLGYLLFPAGNQLIPLELPGNFLFQTKAFWEEGDLVGKRAPY